MISLLKGLVLNNFWWKLAAVVLAGLIWVTTKRVMPPSSAPRTVATILKERYVTRTLPIVLMSVANDTGGFVVTPSEVEVTVTGSEDALKELGPANIKVFVDLVDVKVAKGLLKKVQVSTPSGVTLVSVKPEEVNVERELQPTSIPTPQVE